MNHRSFRDPAGQLFEADGRLLRRVRENAAAEVEGFLTGDFAREAMRSGRIVQTRRLSDAEREKLSPGAPLLLEHERVPFPSYPDEWPPQMLHAAALLTLSLAEEALAEGYGLKDATPFNVLFRGPRPIFVDILSFERRDPRDPVWVPYSQFVQTFVLPLACERYLGIPARTLLAAHREGVTPGQVSRLRLGWRRFARPFFLYATVPGWLSRPGERYVLEHASQPPRSRSAEQADFLLRRTFAKLRHALTLPRAGSTEWVRYGEQPCSYSAEDFAEKLAWVARAIENLGPRSVLDLGANTGRFSELAARSGAAVVAVDRDAAALGALWSRADHSGLDILPLVVDIADPTPARGWAGLERRSFLERARGKFDLVLALGLVHHLLVSERIDLRSLVEVFDELTTSCVIVEFIARTDPMFRRIARGREELHTDHTEENFVAAWSERFRVEDRQVLGGGERALYLLRKRRGSSH